MSVRSLTCSDASTLALNARPRQTGGLVPNFVLLSNYMYDMQWLLAACPALQAAPVVRVAAGHRSGLVAGGSA